MNKYTVEIQVNTSGSIFSDGNKQASLFEVGGFSFSPSCHNFDDRPGQRYFVSGNISAESYSQAYYSFREKLTPVIDSLAYFYSQPVSLEYWNSLVKKEGSDTAWLSAYKSIPATTMTDYSVIDSRIEKVIELASSNEDFQNILWIYNNIAKIDGVDYDPASHQFGLCQLIEALAEVEHVSYCKGCNRGGHDRTSYKDIEAMLGKDLMKKLYLGGQDERLRNRLGHGRLMGARFLTNDEVEEVILRINIRINEKFGVTNVVEPGMTDRIRGVGRWFGGAMGVAHEGMGLEDCLSIYYSESNNLKVVGINTKEQ